jgi:hypothetical protein
MTDDTNETLPPPEPTPDETPEPAAARTRWRDRVVGFRGVLAVAAAGLILGGLGGTAIGVVVSGDDDHGRGPARTDFREGDHGPRGVPGRPGTGVPPMSPPQDDVQPDDPGDTDSGTSS